MKSGIKNLVQFSLVALASFILIACDDGKKNSGGGTVYPQCVPSQANNFQCNPGYPNGNNNQLQGYLYISNKGAYRQLLQNAIGCGGYVCDQIDNQAYITVTFNSFSTTGPSQGNAFITVMSDYGGNVNGMNFGGQFFPSQNGTVSLQQGLPFGNVEVVVSITDINAYNAPVQLNRVDQFGNRTFIGSANLMRNQPFY